MSLRMTTKENWVREETMTQRHKRAVKNLEKVKQQEKENEKQGMKKIVADHPTSPRAKIIRWK